LFPLAPGRRQWQLATFQLVTHLAPQFVEPLTSASLRAHRRDGWCRRRMP
jgi:hypothetical protein